MSYFRKLINTPIVNPLSSAALRNRYKIFMGLSLWGGYNYYFHNKEMDKKTATARSRPSYREASTPQAPPTFSEKIYNWIRNIYRFIQLCIIFTPALLTLPLLFTPYKSIFLKAFVSGVEKAGVVFIKVFQYLSHRRDIIGPDLAQLVEPLRQSNAVHSFEETEKIIQRNYGKSTSEMFDQFSTIPIASGSVGQVYQAKFKGKWVAVKVLHPNVQRNINRDLDMIYAISRVLSRTVSMAFEIPITFETMKRTLNEQMNLTRQKENLERFAKNFEGQFDIKFPVPYEQSTDEVLIETYVKNSRPVVFDKMYDEKGQLIHNSDIDLAMNKLTARIGAHTFFQMILKHNFIHADCHGGNLLVSVAEDDDEEEDPKFLLSRCKYLVHKFYLKAKGSLMSYFMPQELRKLYQANAQDAKMIRKLVKNTNKRVKLTLIDAGMIIELQDKDQQYFATFLKQIIIGDPRKTAELIYRISKYDNQFVQNRVQSTGVFSLEDTPIVNPKFPDYLADLERMLVGVRPHGTEVVDAYPMQVVNGTLNIIRKHNMKLDGQFAALMTNFVVVESIARQLDPQMTILGCAVPYFIDRKKLIDLKMEKWNDMPLVLS